MHENGQKENKASEAIGKYRENNMDKITIKDLEVFAHHGVFKEENVLGQKFVVSVTFFLDTSLAGKNDDLDKSINYADAAWKIKDFLEKNTYKLLETAAEKLAKELLLTYPMAEKLEVEIKKPWAPILLPLDTASVTIERGWHTAYLSIGANLGDKEANLKRAIELLNENPETRVTKQSDFIVTEPFGGVEQDDFLNGALEIKTLLSPQELLALIGKIETEELKRVREIHWGPRTIDLDIIFYDDLVIREENLIVPHIGMAEREFVLKPMEQIAPTKVHPIYGLNVYQLYEKLKKNL